MASTALSDNRTACNVNNTQFGAEDALQLHIQELPQGYRLPQHDLEHLSRQERRRLEHSARADKSHRSMAAYVALRHMLSRVLACPADEIDLVLTQKGRPALHPRHGLAREELDFSISHCSCGFAVCLALRHYVGLDIETFSPRQTQSFNKLFAGRQGPGGHTRLTALELWTRMEAYGKMQGEGLGYGLTRLFRIANDPACAPIPCRFFGVYVDQHVTASICVTQNTSPAAR